MTDISVTLSKKDVEDIGRRWALENGWVPPEERGSMLRKFSRQAEEIAALEDVTEAACATH